MHNVSQDNSIRIKPRRLVIVWLVISQLLAVGSLVPWLAYAIYAYIALSNGISTIWEAVFISFTFAYPILVIACAILAWRLYHAHKDWQALLVTSVFLVGPIFYAATIYVTSYPR